MTKTEAIDLLTATARKETYTDSDKTLMLNLVNMLTCSDFGTEYIIDDDKPEVWHSISGYEGMYEISSKGRVKSLERRSNKVHVMGKMLKPNVIHGHLYCVLQKPGEKPKCVHIARLVLNAFVSEAPGENMFACHKNGNPFDNNIENLYWGTAAQNARDTFKTANDRRSRLSVEDVLEIKRLTRCGYKRGFLQELEKRYNVGRNTIWNIVVGKSWSWLNEDSETEK